nr:sulfatase [Allorhodopirellula solitaria]
MLLSYQISTSNSLHAEVKERPNFVIIFTDDQGYGDLGCFGSTKIETPRIDQMATEGRRFTSFMVASPVCTPSRAALMTGCYPKRVGLHRHVLFPQSKIGLNPDEVTVADHLKGLGYATACYGKWHLGHHPETLPRQNGFDEYFGIPYSNDMNHPDNKRKPRMSSDELWLDPATTLTHWKAPLIENETIVELPADQRTITRRYTDHAVEFITDHQDEPFFVYLAHSMPHIPLYVPEDAYDPDPKNAYTCVIEHIDSEVGRVMDTIKELDLAENTIVIYTSDNGPWLQFKNHGGSAGPLRAGKGTTFEGGQRVPCVMWGPGRIPANTQCDELMGTIDILPTIASLTNSMLSPDQKIDGMDLSGLVTGEATQSPRREFVHYTSHGKIEGIRQGDWKLLAKQPAKKQTSNSSNSTAPAPKFSLFDLANDLGEQNNLAKKHPDIVEKLHQRMLEIDAEIEAEARLPWEKTGQSGKVSDPKKDAN